MVPSAVPWQHGRFVSTSHLQTLTQPLLKPCSLISKINTYFMLPFRVADSHCKNALKNRKINRDKIIYSSTIQKLLLCVYIWRAEYTSITKVYIILHAEHYATYIFYLCSLTTVSWKFSHLTNLSLNRICNSCIIAHHLGVQLIYSVCCPLEVILLLPDFQPYK